MVHPAGAVIQGKGLPDDDGGLELRVGIQGVLDDLGVPGITKLHIYVTSREG